MNCAIISVDVKIQLTKNKTIEIGRPSTAGGGTRKSSSLDMTGVELRPGDPTGCPALRLTYKKKKWQISAAARIPAPDGDLPEQWEDMPKQPRWELPKNFTSPHAAIAVSSSMGAFSQGTADAIIQEMIHGVAPSQTQPQLTAASPAQKRFSIKRDRPSAAPAPEKATTPAPVPVKKPEFPSAGIPVSENGRRFVVKPVAEEGFHLSASLPEFQALWISRLLPEGKRPTASSIQLAESALMASVLLQPAFRELKGSAMAVFVRAESIYIAGYKNGEPILWRRCPGAVGYLAMRTAVIRTLGIGEDLVDSVLNESLIDPRPALEPFVRPVLDQLDLARAYLAGKHNVTIEKVLLIGLPVGAEHWARYAEEALKIQLVPLSPFEGLELGKDVEVENPDEFLIALGAAIAAAEVEL